MTALLDALASLPPGEDAAVLAGVAEDELRRLYYGWAGVRARPEQLPPPGDWRTWLYLAGRGAGKTRAGVEWVKAEIMAGRRRRMALIGPTAADVRDVMVEGESGLLRWCPNDFRPTYEPSKRRLTFPNGAICTTYSADEPDRLRGPQHDGGWCDEPGAWRYPEAWDMYQFGLRLGNDPRTVVTGTPKPVRLIRELLASPTTAITRGSTYDNRANLAPAFFEQIIRQYEGTRLGRQEIGGELLDDQPGALWQRGQIDEHRVRKVPDLVRIVVGVDPEATSGEGAAETGIIVAAKGADGHGYVLDDASLRGTPHAWATAAVTAYHKHRANLLVAETNQGGEMVQQTIRGVDATVPYKGVHASKSKQARAEPIASLAEQGRIHHVGTFAELEDQLCSWVPGAGPSPDRLDAMVWALSELLLENQWTWGAW